MKSLLNRERCFDLTFYVTSVKLVIDVTDDYFTDCMIRECFLFVVAIKSVCQILRKNSYLTSLSV